MILKDGNNKVVKEGLLFIDEENDIWEVIKISENEFGLKLKGTDIVETEIDFNLIELN